MIPHPLCLLRTLWRSVVWGRCRAVVIGHDWEQQAPETGQPSCVAIMRCMICKDYNVAWTRCKQCGQSTQGGKHDADIDHARALLSKHEPKAEGGKG